MKNGKVMKRMGLVLLLVCVLALSGCYAKTPTIEGTTGNLFPEYPTQNVNVNANSPAPSNAPEAGSAGNGNVITLPTAGGNATVNVINQQTPVVLATNTVPPLNAGMTITTMQPLVITTDAPTATPSNILKLGATGAAVKDLQQKLKALGYLKGSADGDFGEMTEAAVKAFQKQMGLTVDGVAGIDTLRKLASTNVTARPEAVVTPVPDPTSKPQYSEDTYLQVGSSGSLVTKMQDRLIQLGYLSGEATGRFDEATKSAVIAFQKRNCSYWDGIAGKLTLDVLFSSSAKGTSTSVGMVGTSLKVGSEGNEVRSLQSRLKELGYYTGNVDGDFGQSTEEAVKAFQRNNGLTADGKAGSETITKMNSSSVKKASSSGSNVSGVLELGSRGAEVVELQSRLKKLGYYTGNVDGDFGDSTRLAVRAFQKNNNLYVDGRVGAGTADVLYSSNAKSAGEDVLELGSRGDEVIALQNRLKKLGYYSGNVDGDFGDSTRLAVRAFQSNNGLTVDGRVGAGTSAKLFSSSAKSATPKPTVKPTEAPSATLQMGSTGERVVRLQSRLKTLGYYNGNVDGDFGAATRDAVRAFQRQNGLTVDGKVGQTTWDKINGNSKTAAPSAVATPVPENVYVLVTPAPDGSYVTLQRGHYGSLVRELQQELKDQGYFSGTVDGYFGESTEVAVKKLQRAKGLQEDGKAGHATQRVLFEGDFPFGA